MKIIISPAKKMKENSDLFPVDGLPRYLNETKRLCREIQKLSLEESRELWKCNEKLARLNYKRFEKMDLEKGTTPALLAYEGLLYQHMAPVVFTREAADYVKEHLRILSGFYGVLCPFDRVTPYRLEMQASLAVEEEKNLYEFWGDKLYQAVVDEDRVIVNLASKEYSKAIEKYLQPEDRFLTVVFGELYEGKIRQKGTLAKMARGEMVRYMAENQVKDLEKLKDFRELGYEYWEKDSRENQWVFLSKD